jgi:hypothetical protein
MAAPRIRLLFENFIKIFPQLFARVIRGTTETVVLDKVDEEYQKLTQGIRPSNQQEEAKSNSNSEPKNHSELEFHQREFTNVDHNSQKKTNF